MKRPITRTRYLIHLLLIGVVVCLFLSKTVAAERIIPLAQAEAGAIELADPLEMEDISVAEDSPCTGEIHLPCVVAKEATEIPTQGELEFKDRYTVCSKTVDKGCVIVGLTETRK